ncbi:hypothetical protein [Janibacter cremeus]|uniref:Uncharacterized protein n=1 Tax=Janibacter cremeus TaxID=1285192 RepID=A0A852VZT6_9MICO|nr:hypothetical protein [Janibacter cremeus]NYF99694.1 hypothetical protein [Janibacter cremeus]
MDAEEITWHQLQNVVMFYGIGGVGKTELSLQLAEWIEGRPSPPSWGVSPIGDVSATVRWDLNSSHGQADPLWMLLHLRRGLRQVRQVWPAFDLPFVAFAQQARPGQQIILRHKNEEVLSVQDVLSGLLSDAATAADLAGGGGGAAVVTGLGHTLVSKAVSGSRARAAFREFDGLKSLVEDCERYSGDAEQGVELCARILEMLSVAIDRMPAGERPLIVVFVDTFERVQVSHEATGEAALNRLVSASPYLFFVVTGRDSLRWHEEQQIHLVRRGAATWPGLLLDGTREREPRQHLVGNLSEADTLDYLQRALTSVGASVGPDVPLALYDLTRGWPLHLEAIVEVARNRASRGTLTMEDLGGKFPQLVNKLMRGFPDDERQAFNAACLLPYFDEQLVAHAGQVSVGTVRRLVQRSIVLPDASPVYPHRIHDELRSVVREAGSDVNSGWVEQDWERHARLALDEAFDRFDTALREGQDRAAVLALALAINIAIENRVWDERLIVGVRRSPTSRGLSALVPAS